MGIIPARVWYGYVTFNGLPSYNYGILVEHPPGYRIAERDYEYIHVPGRNGDLIIDKGSYKNVNRDYDIAFGSEVQDYQDMAMRVSEWLHSASGYAMLYDTYEPDFARHASFVDEGDFENILAHAGRASISFNCKPQRYFITGLREQVVTGSGASIEWTGTNPTTKPSLPHMDIRGSAELGTVQVYINGSLSMTISNSPNRIIIDSDIQDVYSGSHISLNNNTILASSKFPTLVNRSSGTAYIRITCTTGTITRLGVIPRWWTL